MEIRKIFIVGTGLMGFGIAQVAIASGYETVLRSRNADSDAIEKNVARLTKSFAKQVEKGKMTREAMEAALAKFSMTSDLGDAKDADMIIEAVVEKAEEKKSIFQSLSGICREDAIFATNTSSISTAEIAPAVKNPSRFIGMHFFSPVPAMKLLELVKGISTSPETIAIAKEVGARLGKTCIVSKDSPAFIVNRLLVPMMNEAVCLLEAGIGSIEDIDTGAVYGLNHPMGPLELMDLIGIEVAFAALEVIHAETVDPKYRPAPLFRKMVRMGWLGQKTGKGFYIYNQDGTRVPNPDLI